MPRAKRSEVDSASVVSAPAGPTKKPRAKRSPDSPGAAWLKSRGHEPFDFQRAVWQAMAESRSGLLHATTGAGKTYAVWLGALQVLAADPVPPPPAPVRGKAKRAVAAPLTVLWLTPMRALAADTLRALNEPLATLAPHWRCATRTGDTSPSERAAQTRRLPTALITTPESLSLLLSRADARAALSSVRLVVVDEWHELMGNKRGVQTQLALARLAQWNPQLMVWGLSATLGNLDDAIDALLPRAPIAPTRAAVYWPTVAASDEDAVVSTGEGPGDACAPWIVRGQIDKALIIDTLLPARAERFAWAGHMGLQMLPQVAAAIDEHASTLVFTNTRSQAERWYRALLDARPEFAGQLAIHHGSLDKSVRDWVETNLKAGKLKAVVATSSLDLGVDFLPVERVLQIGSCKGVARLIQRAGRSGHAPGRASRISLVPTHSLELVEAAAAQRAVAAGRIEARQVPRASLDTLVQHLVTVALGGGFTPDALYDEIRHAASYRALTPGDWAWCLDFVRFGGPTLTEYPDFRRVVPDADGVWRVDDARLARRHRANIGTIVSDAMVTVQYLRGSRIGSVEESFIARLRPGEVFTFGGRLLTLVRVEQMTAYVRRAASGTAALPRWNGGRMPLTSTLADAIVEEFAAFDAGGPRGPEMQAVASLLEIQKRRSALPTPEILLAETLKNRQGWHLFLYPFAGRQVHLGLSSLLAWRAGQHVPATFSLAVNDYGLEMLSATPVDYATLLPMLIAAPTEHADDCAAGLRPRLLAEVLASLNAGELARRRFREIARIAGLIFQSYPGEQRSARQLQASASLYYEVFLKHDPANRLLHQAQQELLQQELDIERLATTLAAVNARRLSLQPLEKPSPLAFPLMVERFRETLSTESLANRIARMVTELELDAGGELVGTDHAPVATLVEADYDVAATLQLSGAGEGAFGPRKAESRRAPRKNGRPRASRDDSRVEPIDGVDLGIADGVTATRMAPKRRVPKPRLARRPRERPATHVEIDAPGDGEDAPGDGQDG